MNTLLELQAASNKYRKQVWRYFYGRKKNLSKYLEEYQNHELNALWLLSIEKPTELSLFLDTPFYCLERLINNPIYKFYQVEKKKGGKRDIYAPNDELKKIQKKLNYYLQASYLCVKPEEAHGFVINPGYLGAKCNIVENARPHTQKKYVLNIDLKDFFSNISGKQVWGVFSSYPFNYNEQISTALTLLTTYEGKLPTGAPTSPVISNFICLKLDAELKDCCATHLLAYTRYADDLTFSSNNPISDGVLLDITNRIKNNGFVINEKKLRIRSSNKKQMVTGIVVNEKVNVDRTLLRKIKAMVYDLSKNGLRDATQKHFKLTGFADKKYQVQFINRLQGYINFVGQVRGKADTRYLSLKQSFDDCFGVKKHTDIKEVEFKIEFFNKAYKKEDYMKLAINSYLSGDYKIAANFLDDFIYTNRFLSIEANDMVNSLKYLLEYRELKSIQNQ
jgi:RNA-directed DNA polymerase